MAKQKQTVESQAEKEKRKKSRPATTAKMGEETANWIEVDGQIGLVGGSSVEAQAARLSDGRLPVFQRRVMAAQMEGGKGNHHLRRILSALNGKKGVCRYSAKHPSVDSAISQVAVQREAAHWYTPWIQEFSFSPGGTYEYLNVELNTLQEFDIGWKRDAVGSGLLSAVAGLATSVTAKRLGLSELLSYGLGTGSAYYRSYRGYTVEERIWGRLVNVHQWYGRYRINIITGELKAVEFQERGPSKTTMVVPFYYQERVADADSNSVYKHTIFSMTMPGVDLKKKPLPERSFGTFG